MPINEHRLKWAKSFLAILKYATEHQEEVLKELEKNPSFIDAVTKVWENNNKMDNTRI